MTRRRHRVVFGGALAVVVVALACSQVSTDPNSVLSLELRPMQLPSIVLHDSIHDTTGAVDSLHAYAYNAQGALVAGAPIRFLAITGRGSVQVDSVSGQVVGDTIAGRAFVLASVGILQTKPDTIFVVNSPDSLIPLDSTTYTLDYNKATLRDTLWPLRVKLLHLPGDTVPHYRLQYAFTYKLPNTNLDPFKVQLVNVASVPQLVDTTVVTRGASTLSLRVAVIADTLTDSVGVNVYAYRPDHTPVPGSPVHFVIKLHIH